MFKNYLVVAWRNLGRQKGLSFISIFGLALGIACFSLFLLYALNEFGFDGFHKHAAEIYRAYEGTSVWKDNRQEGNIFTPMPLGPAMKQDLPDVEQYVRYVQSFETYLKVGAEPQRQDIAFADPAFFSVFSFKLRYGNPRAALMDLHSIVLTEETAKRLFGATDVVGKQFQVKVLDNSFETFTVTAVAEDLPANSYFGFDMLASFSDLETTTEGRGDIGNWRRASFQTFVQLRPGSRLAADQRRLTAFRQKYEPTQNDTAHKEPLSLYGLEPLKQMHTDLGLAGFMNSLKIPPVDPTYIWMLLAIAAGVLVIACINFTTLSVGRSANRAKEVGVRKAIGGSEGSLRWQFLVEAYVLTGIATILGLLFAKLLLPWFNELTGRTLRFSLLQYPLLPWTLGGLVLCVGLLAGGYPAVILSRFKAVEVLKSRVRMGGSNVFTRSSVTLQFVLSMGLIIATIVIMQQLRYLRSKDPGFQKENVIVVKAHNIPDLKRLYPLFRQELASRPDIIGIAASDNGFGPREGSSRQGINYGDKSIMVYQFGVDPNYLPVMGMQLLAGRNFDATIATDTLRSVIINETLMKTMGWTPDKAIGQRLKGMQSGDTTSPPVVIGVVRDFNFQSMNSKVEPQVFHRFPGSVSERFYIRIRPGDPAHVLSAIAGAWKKVAPDYPLKYNFVQEDLDRFYDAETRLGRIVGWAGGISIFLACLGLLGLAALATVNRTKEIGIRKLLGASVATIVGLISREFVRLVGLAFLIAAPIVWYCMSKWLQGFYYRIVLQWWIFVVAGIVTAGVAWLVVAVLAAKAGKANPVKSLRTE